MNSSCLRRSEQAKILGYLLKRTLLLIFAFFICCSAMGQTVPADRVSTQDLKKETNEFFAREIAAHFADIKSLNPPQERVVGALTTGEFSWGSFAGALAAQANVAGTRTIAGKDTARAVAEIGLIEKEFSL